MEGDVILDGLPFMSVDLDGKLLSAAVVASVGDSILNSEFADFFF